jgi:hypothetical protein
MYMQRKTLPSTVKMSVKDRKESADRGASLGNAENVEEDLIKPGLAADHIWQVA